MSAGAIVVPGAARPSVRGSQQWQILGGLRFYLASIVVCGHLFRFIPAKGIFNRALLGFGKLDAVAAVIGFLVISGYSIAHSAARQPDGYYRRRLIRIYPLYLVGVLSAVGLHLLVGPAIRVLDGEFLIPNASTIAGNLVFLQGFTVHPITANRPLWTLAVEVFCYLFAPLLLRLDSRKLLALMLISLGAYALFPKLHLDFYSRLLWGEPVLFLAWAWLGGFALYRKQVDPTFTLLLLFAGVFALSANQIAMTRFAPFTFALSVVVLGLAARIRVPDLFARLLGYVGEISYPLYIVHLPMLIFGYVVLGLRSGPALALLALLGAIAAYHLVDVPIRVRSRRRRAASGLATARPEVN